MASKKETPAAFLAGMMTLADKFLSAAESGQGFGITDENRAEFERQKKERKVPEAIAKAREEIAKAKKEIFKHGHN
jgi:hypothetical protein